MFTFKVYWGTLGATSIFGIQVQPQEILDPDNLYDYDFIRETKFVLSWNKVLPQIPMVKYQYKTILHQKYHNKISTKNFFYYKEVLLQSCKVKVKFWDI